MKTMQTMRAQRAREYLRKQIEKSEVNYQRAIERMDAAAAYNIRERINHYEAAILCIDAVLQEVKDVAE